MNETAKAAPNPNECPICGNWIVSNPDISHATLERIVAMHAASIVRQAEADKKILAEKLDKMLVKMEALYEP